MESIRDPDVGIHLGMFDPANTALFDALLDGIKRVEHRLGIQTVRVPSPVRDCATAEGASMSRDGEHWRLVADPFADTLEIAARHLFNSYRDLAMFSCVTELYAPHAQGGLGQRTAYTLACYLDPGTEALQPLYDALQGLKVTERVLPSTVAVRGQDNQPFYPRVRVLEATLWESAS